MTPTNLDVEADAFFWQLLPTAVAANPGRFATLRGRIAVKCGDVAVTVDLGNVAAPVVAGFDKSADVRLWFFGDAFARFLRGEVLVGKKDRLVQGDAAVLERFGGFLRPAAPQSAVSVRFAAAAL